MSAVIIPFPTGLKAADINGRLQSARQMPSLAPTAERRAYITGYLDCMLLKISEEKAATKLVRRSK